MKKFYYSLILFLVSFICMAQFQVPDQVSKTSHTIKTNHQIIENYLNEYFNSCAYFGVDFEKGLQKIESVLLVDESFNFIGSHENGKIKMNSKLLYYPNLMRWVLFNELGQHYGLKLIKNDARLIMYYKLEMNARSEFYAETLFHARHQNKIYFRKLEKKLPLSSRI